MTLPCSLEVFDFNYAQSLICVFAIQAGRSAKVLAFRDFKWKDAKGCEDENPLDVCLSDLAHQGFPFPSS
jgi:hypothetical protein